MFVEGRSVKLMRLKLLLRIIGTALAFGSFGISQAQFEQESTASHSRDAED